MKRSVFKICLFVLLLISSESISQGISENPTDINEIPTAPSMWEFEKFGNYRVGMHTGVPEISIPITTATSGMLQVPISIRYHASGIKVDQHASWVGLGWSLNAGGAITRTVRGGNDFHKDGYIQYPYRAEGTIEPHDDYYDIDHMMLGPIDTEPDTYNYSFLGYSGRFIFNRASSVIDATVALIPHNDLKVIPDFTNNKVSFTIITPEGIKAEFTSTESVTETRSSLGVYEWPLTAKVVWHLTKLIDPYGVNEITFEYELTSNVTMDNPIPSISKIVSYPDYCNSANNTLSESVSPDWTSYSGMKKISRINFKNGYLLFNASSDNRIDDPINRELRLDDISVYSYLNGTSTLIKKHEFNYGYFGTVNSSGTTERTAVRLKLENLYAVDKNGAKSEAHEFSYNDSGAYGALPNRFSFSQDYWGYYNGKTNASLVPKYLYTKRNGNQIYLGNANRNVDHNYSKAGIIQRITYPTKGYTEFEFEGNTATISHLNTQYNVGGLRIKNIKSFNYDDTPQFEKEYDYVQKNNSKLSSGVYNTTNYIVPKDFYSSRALHNTIGGSLSCLGGCSNANPICHDIVTYTDKISSAPTMQNNFTSVYYSEVKEYIGNATHNTGFKWFYYATEKDKLFKGAGPVSIRINRSWDRGQLLKKEAYKVGGSIPVSSTFNIYEEIQIQSPISAYKAGTRFDVALFGYLPLYTGSTYQQQKLSGYRNNQYFITYYQEPVIWKRLKSRVTTIDGIAIKKNFFYNTGSEHTNVIKTTTTGSDNLSLETKIYYPDDISGRNTMAEGGNLSFSEFLEIKKLNARNLHRTSTPIQTVNKKNGQLIAVQRNLYFTNDNLVLLNITQTAKGSGALEDRVVFHDYENGKPIHISKKDGMDVSYIWGYNGQFPIAKIESLAYSNIPTSTITNLKNKSNQDNSATAEINFRAALDDFRASYPKAIITTYTYDPLIGVTSITDPRGQTVYYQYDDFNRLEFIKNAQGQILSKNEYHYKGQ